MATQDGNIAYDLLFVNKFYEYAYPTGSAEHKEFYLATTAAGEIQVSTFMENAIANAAGLTRDSRFAADVSDGSEVKCAVSCYRNNNLLKGSWMHTYEISNVHTKTGPIRFVGYNKITGEFEYYFIPNHAFSHLKGVLTLPIETFSGYYASCGMEPTFTGIRSGSSKWHQYQVRDFITMCQMRAAEQDDDSSQPSKTDPTEQTPILYNEEIV
jgi:hypothetical protein